MQHANNQDPLIGFAAKRNQVRIDNVEQKVFATNIEPPVPEPPKPAQVVECFKQL